MTFDPEAAWPLTLPETGYHPSPTPAPPAAPSNLVPLGQIPQPIRPSAAKLPADQKSPSWGVRIAILAIVLGISIPLTAIALSGGTILGLVKLVVVWVGLVLITAVTMGRTRH